MFPPRLNRSIFKFLSLLSVIRGYNILILIVAQYLAAIFIFSPAKTLRNTLFDIHLLCIILATICVVASGYLINNFYDAKLDRINRPFKAQIDNYVKQSTKLRLYFVLNFLGVIFGLLISVRAALFFAIYIFAIWLYSHKLKKYSLLGVFSATMLTILPFFAVFVYFKNFSKIIFMHALFLFLVIMIRELLKDLQSMKGAIVNNYDTFPVVYGEKKTKLVCLFLLALTVFPIVILFSYPALSYMRYYFYVTLIVFFFLGICLWKSSEVKHYRMMHNVLKILLLIGVFSIIFIDTSLLVEKVIDRLY
jgi:4-hydroxybenzoate polyprenyltransferase